MAKKHNRNSTPQAKKAQKESMNEGRISGTKAAIIVGIVMICFAGILIGIYGLQEKGPAEKEAYGTWEITDVNGYHNVYEIKDDHTFIYTIADKIELTGTWNYQRFSNLSKLNMKFEDEDTSDKEIFMMKVNDEIILCLDWEDTDYCYKKVES